MQLEAADAVVVQSLLTRREPRPLLDAEFNLLMRSVSPFENRPTLAVAVSGGPDSLALTILASRWAKQHDGRAVGLIVDHGLRPEAADEARQTGQWLSRYGVEHHILVWRGPKPTSGVQREARRARYELLFSWCRHAGTLHLLTGHHRQDQAETVALRRLRQSGPRGLSGMAVIREIEGLRLLRPLLGIDKTRLKDTLRHFGQGWIDDPSNRSFCYSRNRLRHQGINSVNLAGQAARHGRDRHVLDKKRHAALAGSVTIHPAGFAQVCRRQLNALPPGLVDDLVASLLMTIGGCIYPPRRQSLGRLIDAMRNGYKFCGQTLSHCLIVQQRERWLFCRERDRASTLALISDQRHYWDSRFVIRCRYQGPGLHVRELGEHGWSKRHQLLERQQACDIPHPARPSLLSIWQDEKLLAIPHAGLFDRHFNPLAIEVGFRPLGPLGNAPYAAHMRTCLKEKDVAVAQC